MFGIDVYLSQIWVLHSCLRLFLSIASLVLLTQTSRMTWIPHTYQNRNLLFVQNHTGQFYCEERWTKSEWFICSLILETNAYQQLCHMTSTIYKSKSTKTPAQIYLLFPPPVPDQAIGWINYRYWYKVIYPFLAKTMHLAPARVQFTASPIKYRYLT